MNGTSPQRVWQSLRQGEVVGLKLADVDLDQGLLRIRSTRTPKTSGLLHPAPNPLATVR
jgi:integrase